MKAAPFCSQSGERAAPASGRNLALGSNILESNPDAALPMSPCVSDSTSLGSVFSSVKQVNNTQLARGCQNDVRPRK